MTKEDVAACKMVNFYRRYCPVTLFQMYRSSPTCLTSLYERSVKGELEQCPIVLLNEYFPHVAELSFGEFTLYSHKSLTARVFCQDQPKSCVVHMCGFVQGELASRLPGGSRQFCSGTHCRFFRSELFVGRHTFVSLSNELNDTLIDVLEWGEVFF